MFYSALIHRALDYAARTHEGQYRKNPEAVIPYVSHCAMVGLILQRAGFDEEVVAAGILHDTCEDRGVDRTELAELFGERIADLVLDVSEEDRSLPWKERKRRYLDRLRSAQPEAIAISVADKIHNLYSLLASLETGAEIWNRMKRGRHEQIERFEEIADFLRESFDHPLRQEFMEILDLLKKKTG
ncbi:hypothetical protein AMJ39_05770 [candidate division TA06 bacterium DG_24]|uniref:HD/PDEase domain-containing protein n=2 Tax=Bacteria division TA06 TaxID=1156500 RepID=A0A0S8G5H8_UNCT6|nr:MAG: hypothetical protein AMJ39_05770 [candidate division TA06 bacterium DG_24]KPK68296.1 MAG: hypothetical protein AMJ82_08660 [candidate division TA06 bacterium SM23_40]